MEMSERTPGAIEKIGTHNATITMLAEEFKATRAISSPTEEERGHVGQQKFNLDSALTDLW